jgi:lipopolysaccharide biosynthesis protein
MMGIAESHESFGQALSLADNEPRTSTDQQQDRLVAHERDFQQLQVELRNKDHSIAEQERTLQVLRAQIAARDQDVQLLAAERARITGSIGWSMLQWFWRLCAFFIPHGSRREALARKVLEGAWRLMHAAASRTVSPTGQAGVPAADATQPGSITRSYAQDKYKWNYATMLAAAGGKEGDEYVPLSNVDFSFEQTQAKLIAFYLPQFHPVPENDLWWGKGFTEWTNVSKAIPQFVGHYQPRLPGELGFYDLRVPEVQRRQVELARKYGIHGFCFYYYWFNGKRLLEQPLDQFVSDSENNFPFCICWANENWTRRWDGLDNDILIAQNHTPESDIEFITHVLPLLEDERYIRVDDRPLLIVYRATLLPDPAGTARRWREYAQEHGLPGLYLAAVQGFGFSDPRPIGFDAAIDFPPNTLSVKDINHLVQFLNPDYAGQVYRYSDAVAQSGRQPVPYPLFQTVFPGWDNESRRPGRGFSFAFSTPGAYEEWLTQVCQKTMTISEPDQRLVFINAWNEWSEGAYLEPDRRYGYAYLQATANALSRAVTSSVEMSGTIFGRTIVRKSDTAIIVHLYYLSLWPEIRSYLEHLEGDFDLFISCPLNIDFDEDTILMQYPHAYIFRCQNRGRDIGPFLMIFRAIRDLDYKYICKIHGKKSPHRQDGDAWRRDVLGKLLGSAKLVREVKTVFDEADNVGVIAPARHVLDSNVYWGSNADKVRWLTALSGMPFDTEFQFVGGSMFWFRPLALYPCALLPLSMSDFEAEPSPIDGTLAHALERYFGLLLKKSDYVMLESDGETFRDAKPELDYGFAPTSFSDYEISRSSYRAQT